jgi:hypothetical protein
MRVCRRSRLTTQRRSQALLLSWCVRSSRRRLRCVVRAHVRGAPELSRLAIRSRVCSPGADAQLVQSPLCMVLFTCCRKQPERLAALTGTQPGVSIVSRLLAGGGEVFTRNSKEPRPESTGNADWLPLLIGEVCSSGHGFVTLHRALGGESAAVAGAAAAVTERGVADGEGTAEQGLLLHVLAEAIELRHYAAPEESTPVVRMEPRTRLLWRSDTRCSQHRLPQCAPMSKHWACCTTWLRRQPAR